MNEICNEKNIHLRILCVFEPVGLCMVSHIILFKFLFNVFSFCLMFGMEPQKHLNFQFYHRHFKIMLRCYLFKISGRNMSLSI